MSAFSVTMLAMLSFLAGVCVAISLYPTEGKLSACRAANPGYDCSLGWVRGEAFK